METIGIELTRFFVKVVQHGSFTKAAAAMRIPKSTVSKAISRLEAETGTKLLVRTTRNQTLTTAGRVFYETCLGPIQVLEDAQKSLFGQDNIVAGKIKLTAPEDLGNLVITPAIALLCKRYPKLSFETMYSNEVVDLVKDGYDFAVRIGELDQSSLLQRKIGEIQMIPVASPTFIKTIGKISSPKDLDGVDGLDLQTYSFEDQWILQNGKKTAHVRLKIRIFANQMSSLINAVVAGAGVALVPSYLVGNQLTKGLLVRLLPEWHGERLKVSMISPVSMSSSSRLNIISSELLTACREALIK